MGRRIDHRWPCTFKGGRINWHDPAKVAADCTELEGKDGYCILEPFRNPKSVQEHRYYFGVVCKRFAEYWGCSVNEAHLSLSREHLQVIPEHPEQPVYIRSTSLTFGGWKTDEWEEYMEFLRTWGLLTFGLYIELPREVDLTKIRTVF